MDETERALRAATEQILKLIGPAIGSLAVARGDLERDGEPLDQSDGFAFGKDAAEAMLGEGTCEEDWCDEAKEVYAILLPLFNAGIAGAYAAAAKEAGFRVRFLITGTPDEQAAHMESCILALTPADARQAQSETERMACGHLKADWVEAAHVWHQGPCVLGCTKAHCRTCAAIASAEAQARLEEHKHDCEECETAIEHGAEGCNRAIQLIAAARTPDNRDKTNV